MMLEAAKQTARNLWSKRPALLRGRSGWIIAGAAVLLIGAWAVTRGGDEEPYRTAAIDRGAVTRVVSATGTLQPLVSANVGSTVSGPVQSVEVDFNSQVREGQVLARLDPAQFQQRVQQAQAQLASARAQAAVANADYERYERLAAAGFASEQLMNQQRAARDSARASVAQVAASLAQAQTDLDRSVIRSPITGVVVDRQVSVGQSVAASFQAATLFVIAQDLSRLQADITVDEADIGDVREGQLVRFTVDAFPDREFEGQVSQVRQQGVAASGVVSYTVVVEADNPGRRLLPGMTANADIILEEQDNVLRLPNAALRFRPADAPPNAGQAMASEARGQRGQGRGGQGGQAAGRGAEQLAQQLELTEEQQAAVRQAFQTAAQAAASESGDRRGAMRRIREQVLAQIEPTLSEHQQQLLAQLRADGGGMREVRRQATVWVLRNNKATSVAVETGIADNGYTVLLGGDLREGDQVIIGGGPQAANAQGARSGAGPLGGGRPVRVRGA